MKHKYEVQADGYCTSNPGTGGYAFAGRALDGKPFTVTGSVPKSTNPDMELFAIAAALKHASIGATVHLSTSSRLGYDGLTRWLPGWLSRGMKNSQGRVIAHARRWQEIALLIRQRKVTFSFTPRDATDASRRVAYLAKTAAWDLLNEQRDDELVRLLNADEIDGEAFPDLASTV